MESPIQIQDEGQGIWRVQLNLPDRRNPLTLELLAALQAAFDRLAAEASVKVVILSAEGPVFCAGHDLKAMRAELGNKAYFERLFALSATVMQRMLQLPFPVIAEIQGMATAAGCQLVASCDLAVAADSAKFATPGVDIGLFCSNPMVPLSRNVPRKQAMHMLLTGAPISAEKAEQLGLVNTVVPGQMLREEVMKLAITIAGKSTESIRRGKTAFYAQMDMPIADAYAHASAVMAANMMDDDAAEGISAFIEKRHPNWTN